MRVLGYLVGLWGISIFVFRCRGRWGIWSVGDRVGFGLFRGFHRLFLGGACVGVFFRCIARWRPYIGVVSTPYKDRLCAGLRIECRYTRRRFYFCRVFSRERRFVCPRNIHPRNPFFPFRFCRSRRVSRFLLGDLL